VTFASADVFLSQAPLTPLRDELDEINKEHLSLYHKLEKRIKGHQSAALKLAAFASDTDVPVPSSLQMKVKLVTLGSSFPLEEASTKSLNTELKTRETQFNKEIAKAVYESRSSLAASLIEERRNIIPHLRRKLNTCLGAYTSLAHVNIGSSTVTSAIETAYVERFERDLQLSLIAHEHSSFKAAAALKEKKQREAQVDESMSEMRSEEAIQKLIENNNKKLQSQVAALSKRLDSLSSLKTAANRITAATTPATNTSPRNNGKGNSNLNGQRGSRQGQRSRKQQRNSNSRSPSRSRSLSPHSRSPAPHSRSPSPRNHQTRKSADLQRSAENRGGGGGKRDRGRK
jgi:myosin heavy subunit